MIELGRVFLVGAGPGDPKLLTVRADELLRTAQVVAYDELISAEILSLISPEAESISVGRRHGDARPSFNLHPVVLERARAGKTVVRLKSGDPLIFGRGAEEAEELARAGVPFEIVPGVSAAAGAAAYAGIPLTDRRVASRVTIATGHSASSQEKGRGETIVLYMGGSKLVENLARLIAGGRHRSTPAAYIAAATTPRQLVVVGTLGDLAAKVDWKNRTDPALVIVGDVVCLRDRIEWFEGGAASLNRASLSESATAKASLARGSR
jgi:uroporphyrinogen III methyltransferase / synthase